jgi:hypothetical protein
MSPLHGCGWLREHASILGLITYWQNRSTQSKFFSFAEMLMPLDFDLVHVSRQFICGLSDSLVQESLMVTSPLTLNCHTKPTTPDSVAIQVVV